MNIFLKKINNKLEAIDVEGEQYLQKLPEGQNVKVTIKRSRSPQHHRLLFSLLTLTLDNQVDEAVRVCPVYFVNKEHLLTAIKVYLGLSTTYKLPNNKSYEAVKSIAFDSMSQDAFNEFFKGASEFCSEVLSSKTPAGIQKPEPNDLIDEVMTL